jgi:sugar phosphate isomerase/epimerase
VDAAYLNRLKLHAFRLGLDISGTAIGNNFTLPPGPERDRQLELTRTWIDHAATLGAPVIRIFAGNTPRGDTEEAAIDRAVEAIESSLEYAAEKGVALALENHGGVTTEAETLVRIVERIQAPAGNFGINFDSGNFRSADPYAELALIAPYAINAQIKTEMHVPGGGKTPADLGRILDILREAKYSGYVALEYEAAEDPFEAIPRYIEELKSLLGRG